MSTTKIASRYAKSLIDLAIDQNTLEEVFTDMKAFLTIAQMKDFSIFLKSPVIKADKKIRVINAIFDGRVHRLTMAFLRIITNKGREEYLQDISAQFVHQYNELKGISNVRLTGASELTKAQKTEITQKLKKEGLVYDNVIIDEKVDPGILGGFIVEVGDKLYDASLTSKLRQMRKELMKS